MDVVKSLYSFFGGHRIIPVNWVAIYTTAQDMPKGMEACYNLGREVVQFAKSRPQFRPDFEQHHVTYGTHTR